MLWDGYPLSSSAVPNKVWIDGDVYFDRSPPGIRYAALHGGTMKTQVTGHRWQVSGKSCAAKTVAVVTFAIWTCAVSFAQQQPLVLKGGKLLTVSRGAIDNGVLVMQGGKISALGVRFVGQNSERCPGHRRHRHDGLTPASSIRKPRLSLHRNLRREHDQRPHRDERRDHAAYARLRCVPCESELIPVTRINGVTNAIVAPDSEDTLPGQDSLFSWPDHLPPTCSWYATLPCR